MAEPCEGDECPPQTAEPYIQPNWRYDTTTPWSQSRSRSFTVTNIGSVGGVIGFGCGVTGPAQCDSVVSPLSYFPKGTQTTVNIWYSSLDEGSATVILRAWEDQYGTEPDSGRVSFKVIPSDSAPILSLAPHNGSSGGGPSCLTGCEQASWAHATPAYVTLGRSRSVGFTFTGSQASPRGLVAMDVKSKAGYAPTAYEFIGKRVSTGANITWLNGATSVFYEAQGSSEVRVLLPFDPVANGLSTGAHEIRVWVRSHYPGGGVVENTRSVWAIVVDERGSAFGPGVSMAGLQRVYSQPGQGVLITEGDGSASWYRSTGGAYLTPGGSTATLVATGTGLKRTYPDGSYVTFDVTGRMRSAGDVFGNRDTLLWSDTLLTRVRDPMGKSFKLTYSAGKLTSVQDSTGAPTSRTTWYDRDGSNRVWRIRDPDTKATVFTYDAAGLLTSTTDRAGAVTTFHAGALGVLDSVQAPAIPVWPSGTARPTTRIETLYRRLWGSAAAGTSLATRKPSLVVDSTYSLTRGPDGVEARARVDRFGGVVWVRDALGKIGTVQRDTMGRPLLATGPTGHQVQWSWGYTPQFGTFKPHVLAGVQDLTLGSARSFAYNTQGDVISASEAGVTRTFTYHTGGTGPARSVSAEYQGGTLVRKRFPDALGRDTLQVHGDSTHRARIWYDAATGNVDSTRNPRGFTSRVRYDRFGRDTMVTAPDGAVARTTYGLLNQVLVHRNPIGGTTQFTYNDALGLTQLTDPKNQTYQWGRNALGQVTAAHDLANPALADSSWYDAAGRPVRSKSRAGRVVTLAYNGVTGAPTSRTATGTPVDHFAAGYLGTDSTWQVAWNTVQRDSLVFDKGGRLVRAHSMRSGRDFAWHYMYDTHSRLTGRSLHVDGVFQPNRGTVSATWNAQGSLGAFTAAGIRTTFTLNPELLATQRSYGRISGSNTFNVTVDPDSNHAGGREIYSIAALNQAFGGAFARDPADRLTESNEVQSGWSYRYRRYAYDGLGRLTRACTYEGTIFNQGSCEDEYGDVNQDTYAYDAAGNRTDVDAGAVVGAGNRVQQFRGYAFTYDADGNTTGKVGNGENWEYGYDGFGRITTVKLGGATRATYAYDAFGRRVEKVLTGPPAKAEWLIYSGDQLTLVADTAGQIQEEYGWLGSSTLLGMNAGSDTLIAVNDVQLGVHVQGLVRLGSGAIVKRYALTPWGEPVTADTGLGIRAHFGGHQYDRESGLYWMRARYYDPGSGRFITEDPIGIGGGVNLYEYVLGDPVNIVDGSGMEPGCEYVWVPGRHRFLPRVPGSDPEVYDMPEIVVEPGYYVLKCEPTRFAPLGIPSPGGSGLAVGAYHGAWKGNRRRQEEERPACIPEATLALAGLAVDVYTGHELVRGGVLLVRASVRGAAAGANTARAWSGATRGEVLPVANLVFAARAGSLEARTLAVEGFTAVRSATSVAGAGVIVNDSPLHARPSGDGVSLADLSLGAAGYALYVQCRAN